MRIFWNRANENSEADCQLTFISNGGASKERYYAFPDDLPGLLYWRRAEINADTAPIRAALSKLFSNESIGSWVDQQPSDHELRTRLLRRVQWTLDAAPSMALGNQLREQVGLLFLDKGLPVLGADLAFTSLIYHLFEVACRAPEEERRLTRVDLHRVLEQAETAIGLGQTISRTKATLAEPDGASGQSPLVSELPPVPGSYALRDFTINEVLDGTRGELIVWLHGAHGVGKSTLAKLLAHRMGGRWLTLDLRPVQADSLGCLVAWKDLIRAMMRGAAPEGVIIDDLAGVAVDALKPRIVALAQTLIGRGARIIVTSPKPPLPAGWLEFDTFERSVVQAPYFSENEVLELVAGPRAPDKETQGAWAVFIRLATRGGHPLLAAAKIASLRARSWPNAVLSEDLGPTESEALRATREDARLQLLHELSSLGDSRSKDASEVLRRIACMFDRVDEELARKLVNAEPLIENGGDALAVLRGTWLESLPAGDIRLSPLVGDIAKDVQPTDVRRWQSLAAEHWIARGVLDERTLPLCFWNAFLGRHVWVLLKLCEMLETLPPERLRGAAALLSPIVSLVTDAPIYPDNPTVVAQLRLLQFGVAEATEDSQRGKEIASRLLIEIDDVPIEEIRVLLTTFSAQRVLVAEFADVAPEDRLEFALRLRRVMPRMLSILPDLDPEIILQDEFGPGIDMAGFLFACTLKRIRTSQDFLALVKALGDLSPDDRNSFIDSAATILKGLSVLVGSGWSRDQLAERNMKEVGHCYDEISEVVEAWDRPDLKEELVCARSVIRDEGLGDSQGALDLVDQALCEIGSRPALARQKAIVLSHMGRDLDAAELVLSIEDDIGTDSVLDRALALREGAIAVPRAGRFCDAARLFKKSSESLSGVDGFGALNAGLLTERALVLWEEGKRVDALKSLGDAFDVLEHLPATANRQSERAHQVARAAGGLFSHDTGNFSTDPRPAIEFGLASYLETDESDPQNIDLKPLADSWRIVALVEIQSGVCAGIEQRSILKQTQDPIASLEYLISCARYQRSLESNNLEQTINDGLVATSALFAMKKQIGSDPTVRIERARLSSVSTEVLFKDPPWHEAMLRLPLDALLWARSNGEVDAAWLSPLENACNQVFGPRDSVGNLIKAASGTYVVGPRASLAAATAAAIAKSNDVLSSDPAKRLERDALV